MVQKLQDDRSEPASSQAMTMAVQISSDAWKVVEIGLGDVWWPHGSRVDGVLDIDQNWPQGDRWKEWKDAFEVLLAELLAELGESDPWGTAAVNPTRFHKCFSRNGCIGQLPHQAQSQREITPPSSKEASKAKGLVTRMSKLLWMNAVLLYVHLWYGLVINFGWLLIVGSTLQERQLKQLGWRHWICQRLEGLKTPSRWKLHALSWDSQAVSSWLMCEGERSTDSTADVADWASSHTLLEPLDLEVRIETANVKQQRCARTYEHSRGRLRTKICSRL